MYSKKIKKYLKLKLWRNQMQKKYWLLSFIIIFFLILSCPTVRSGGGRSPLSVNNNTGCLLTINITGSGSIGKTPDKQYYTTGSNVSLAALPDPGYAFDH
jgi:hypothetical protein